MTISLWNLKMALLMMKVHASDKGECFSQSLLDVDDNQSLEPENGTPDDESACK